jgi:hypothetical protein
MLRRSLAPALLLAGMAQAQTPRPPPSGLWFDPTQLPSYTGRVERFIDSPAGETDRLLFREGTQIVMPPTEAEAIRDAVRQGGALTVWGIRARAAPVVVMLAWARAASEGANFVAQPSWFAPSRRGTVRLRVAGVVERALLTPQGEGMGVLLTNGDVLRLPPSVHAALGDALAPGATIFAEGLGTQRSNRVAIDAESLGNNSETMAPLPVAATLP